MGIKIENEIQEKDDFVKIDLNIQNDNITDLYSDMVLPHIKQIQIQQQQQKQQQQQQIQQQLQQQPQQINISSTGIPISYNKFFKEKIRKQYACNMGFTRFDSNLYPIEMSNYLTEQEYKSSIDQINQIDNFFCLSIISVYL
ncbi:hypothetical protein DICPUDRAFT_151126 [Dictyostelium purpureum]|uniref:Uncharacterized protein n=1 Tax=Dictyostelium purpureum TaxID=5786 RepID=F0ZI21_DICPU|nr:uncharacterized protein DICPUDRAFT_151126 [Dictyostelium purpureum]EGC36417.1 hypothetical protein DICPUDRAFT_151126 [Dictyostelium purpureum]|eukprot:XP_003287050.1 hypothetical protein DICPUDRAFT_151126 [Dictyostelium purpureum]